MCNQRLKCFQGLNRTFKTNGSWFDLMLCGGLRHNCPNQIIGQNVSLHFFAHEFRSLAAKEFHLHG